MALLCVADLVGSEDVGRIQNGTIDIALALTVIGWLLHKTSIDVWSTVCRRLRQWISG